MGLKLQSKQTIRSVRLSRLLLVFFLPALLILSFIEMRTAHAAALTWDGGGADNNWSTCANWSADVCPTSADSVTFNSTSVKNATIDAGFGGTVTTLTIASTYTGTITLNRSLSLTTSFSQSGGTFTSGANAVGITGTFTQSGGTFNAPSSSLTVSGNYTYTAGTYSANGGTVIFNGTGATINCGATIFSMVSFTHTSSTKTISTGCTVPVGNDPTISQISNNGTITGSGTLTMTGAFTQGSGSTITGFTGLIVGGTSLINGATLDFSAYTLVDFASFTFNSGTIIAPSLAPMTFSSAFTVNGGTFNANGGTVTFDGTSGTISCNNIVFNLVTFAHTSSKTVSSNCSMPLGNDPAIGRGIVLNGSISGSGTMNFGGGTFTLNSTATISGFTGLTGTSLTVAGYSFDAGAYSTLAVGSFTLNSGVFTAPSSNMSVTGALTITGGTFNANGGTITALSNSGLWSCNNATFSKVVFNHISGAKAISSNCSLPLGNDAVITGSITLNGTLTGTGSLTTQAVTVSSSAQMIGFEELIANGSSFVVDGANLDLSTFSHVDMNSRLDLAAGSLTAPAGTMSIGGELLISNGTFDANGGIVEFDGTTSNNITCNGTVFSLVRFRNTAGGKNVANDCTLPLGNNPTIGSGGDIYLNGSVTGTGTLTATGHLKLQKDALLTGFSGLSTQDLTIGTQYADFSSFTTFDVNGNFSVIKPANFVAPTSTTLAGNVSRAADGGGLQMGAALYEYASSPDSPSVDITGDIDFRIKARPQTWVPGYARTLAGKWAASTNERSYRLRLDPDGCLIFGFSADGTSTTSAKSSIATGLTDGETAWVRFTWRQSDGLVQFFTSEDGITWSQLGDDRTLIAASIHNSSAVFGIGGIQEAPDAQFVGDIYRVQLRNNVLDNGTGIVYDADFTGHPDGTTTFNESSGNNVPVTLTGSSAYIYGPGAGGFAANGGHVILDGADQSIFGDFVFHKLSKTSPTPAALRFGAGSNSTVQNDFTMRGSSVNPLTLASVSPGTQWKLNASGSRSIQYVSVSDSENTSGTPVVAYDSIDGGNNLGWSFVGTPPAAAPGTPTTTPQATTSQAGRGGTGPTDSSIDDTAAQLVTDTTTIDSDPATDYDTRDTDRSTNPSTQSSGSSGWPWLLIAGVGILGMFIGLGSWLVARYSQRDSI